MSAREPGGQAVVAPSQDGHDLTEVVTRLRRALRASVRTDISWESLPMAQVEVLQSLAERAPARVSDLAERLHLANSTVSGLASSLAGAGLIRRDTDPADRRAAVVTLTDEGVAQLEAWQDANERRISAALDRLDEDDRRQVDSAVPALGRLAELLAGPNLLDEVGQQS